MAPRAGDLRTWGPGGHPQPVVWRDSPSSPSLKSLFNRLLKGHSARVLGRAGTREFHLPPGPPWWARGQSSNRVLVVFLDGPSCQLSRLQGRPPASHSRRPLALSGPGAAGMAVTPACPPCPRPRPNPRSAGPRARLLARRRRRFLWPGSSPTSPAFCPLAAGPFSSASPGSQDRKAPMYSRHKTPAFKAQLGASVPRRRQRKGEIESPGGVALLQ